MIQNPASVVKSIVVDVSQARAFDVFVAGFASWWPLETHVLGEAPGQTAIIEPRVGGRCYELDKNGTECDWGRVLAYEPPSRLVFSWEISADFKPDRTIQSEVEVRFIPESAARTRVELEHRGLESYGDRSDAVRTALDSPAGWTGIMARYLNSVSK